MATRGCVTGEWAGTIGLQLEVPKMQEKKHRLFIVRANENSYSDALLLQEKTSPI